MPKWEYADYDEHTGTMDVNLCTAEVSYTERDRDLVITCPVWRHIVKERYRHMQPANISGLDGECIVSPKKWGTGFRNIARSVTMNIMGLHTEKWCPKLRFTVEMPSHALFPWQPMVLKVRKAIMFPTPMFPDGGFAPFLKINTYEKERIF